MRIIHLSSCTLRYEEYIVQTCETIAGTSGGTCTQTMSTNQRAALIKQTETEARTRRPERHKRRSVQRIGRSFRPTARRQRGRLLKHSIEKE